MTGTQRATAVRLAARVRSAARRAGAADPRVRGADWRLATAATVNTDGTIVTADGVKAKRLDSYIDPTAGDLIVITQSGNGNWVAAGRLAAGADTAWVSYTPTWTAATTNPVLGNGTLIGRYQKLGRTVTVHINLTAGSTTTFGSGNYSFALPFPAANVGCTYAGSAYLLQSSRYGGVFLISPGMFSAGPSFPTSSTVSTQSLWSPIAPLTFASGGQVRCTITYEAAS